MNHRGTATEDLDARLKRVEERLFPRVVEPARAPNGGRGSAAAPEPLYVVFDGPPSHESGRFVELENGARQGQSAGEWRQRDDGLWTLGPFYVASPPEKEGSEQSGRRIARLERLTAMLKQVTTERDAARAEANSARRHGLLGEVLELKQSVKAKEAERDAAQGCANRLGSRAARSDELESELRAALAKAQEHMESARQQAYERHQALKATQEERDKALERLAASDQMHSALIHDRDSAVSFRLAAEKRADRLMRDKLELEEHNRALLRSQPVAYSCAPTHRHKGTNGLYRRVADVRVEQVYNHATGSGGYYWEAGVLYNPSTFASAYEWEAGVLYEAADGTRYVRTAARWAERFEPLPAKP